MNRRPSELALVVVSLVCVLVLAACNCAPTLRYITISPSGPTIVIGAQEPFTATGYYSNGAVTPNISVSWSSSNTAVASINGTSGVATGLTAGTTTITATALGITSTTTTLTVAPPTSITVTPASTVIPATGTQQFDAMANYSGGSQDVTAYVTWAAANTGVATFSTTTAGLANAVAAGTTQVTATLDGIVGTASLTVTNGTSLVVTPTSANIAVGNSTTLTVMELLPNNTTQPVTGTVVWSSSTPAQANVVQYGPAGAGIVTGFASTGSSTVMISATEGGLTTTTPAAITVDQGTSQFAYVSNNTGSASNVQSFTVTAGATPYLAPLASTNTPDGSSPWQTVIAPNGQYLFTTSTLPGSTVVTPYAIAANGSLTAGTPVTMTASSDIIYELVDPYGRFLFVADELTPSTTGGIYVYTINQSTGALTLVPGSPFTANLNVPAGLAIDQTGTYLYASNYGNPGGTPAAPGTTLAAFQVNPTTGALTALTTQPPTNGLNAPAFMSWDPTGTYLYVANFANTPSVSSFTLGANGALSALTTTTITGATAPFTTAVSPNGTYLYVLDYGPTSGNGAVYGFTLSSGVPGSSPITAGGNAVGNSPVGIAIDPSSSLLAVASSGSSDINLFTIGSTGALTAPTPPTISTGSGSVPFFVTFYNTF
ncbi:MAG TPA: beta-propeller fold lactonase family protein [Candidatus Sulfotelmatobacter sp.]|nr:beta-propeller fold lactonase family protein [Candidatus Sulfotelmatobacter sp.]